MTPQYLIDCLAHNEFIPEEQYAWGRNNNGELVDNIWLGVIEKNRIASVKSFDGWRICLVGQSKTTEKMLRNFILAGGGILVPKDKADLIVCSKNKKIDDIDFKQRVIVISEYLIDLVSVQDACNAEDYSPFKKN